MEFPCHSGARLGKGCPSRLVHPLRAGSRRVYRTDPFVSRRSRTAPHPTLAEQAIETEGKITQVLAGTMFRVELDNKHQVLAHISGRMRKRFIRLTTGDRVKLEMSPYDLDKARIVYRLG